MATPQIGFLRKSLWYPVKTVGSKVITSTSFGTSAAYCPSPLSKSGDRVPELMVSAVSGADE